MAYLSKYAIPASIAWWAGVLLIVAGVLMESIPAGSQAARWVGDWFGYGAGGTLILNGVAFLGLRAKQETTAQDVTTVKENTQ